MYTTPHLISQDLSNAGRPGAPGPSPFADCQTLIVLVLDTHNKPHHPALGGLVWDSMNEKGKSVEGR